MRALALLSAGSVLAACSPALIAQDSIAPRLGESAEGEGEVVIYDSTVLLDEKAGLLDLQVGTDELVLLTDGTPMGITVGNVVVGQIGGGYLRRVTEVVEQGDRIVLRTESADLSDAIEDGDYRATAEILDRAAHTWDLGGRVIYDGDLYNSGTGEEVHVNLHIAEGANVTLDPTFDFDLQLFQGSWIDAGFQADIDLDYQADFVATVSGAFDERIEGTVLTRTIPFAFYMGPVPVVGSAEVELIAGIEADFEGAVTTSLHTEAQIDATMDAGYDGDWSFDHTSSIDGDLSWGDTSATYSLQTRAWVRAQLTVELYGAAGAELGVEPYLELNTCANDGFDIDGGVKGTHRYYFEALGWRAFDSGVNTVDFGRWDVYAYQCEDGY
ncbi:MAG: hypothetical protein KC656_15140 [Myxococcales bacterium]|nr:hypothetical protein [Myxococcales bacterium]